MLQALYVHNFALLEEAQADFSQGFNVFTGETGAGKSILIDAFGIVLGGRASVELVRHGSEGFLVQAVFDISRLPQVKALLEEQGLDPEEELFLKRQLQANGKGRAFVNGVQVPLSFLKQLGAMLVDIHGQHENQALLKAEAPRELVDSYGGAELKVKLESYQGLYKEYVALRERLEALEKDSENQELLLDRYAWEIREIKAAGLKPGEEETLEAEAKLLQHSEKIVNNVSYAHRLLDAEKGVLDLLAKLKGSLQSVQKYDRRLEELANNADSAWITLEDVREELSAYLSDHDFNGERAQEVQERLDLIYRLHKKYGGSTEAVLEYMQQTIDKYRELKSIAETIAKAQQELQQLTQRLLKAAEALTAVRKVKAQALAEAITEHIRDLAMPNGRFAIALEAAENFLPTGRDKLEFRFSANLGEPLNRLDKVASGGELSRIALALKTVMVNEGDVPTMVFDEIDTGVGGVTAQRMAEKIARISKVSQVLCITHLPQIAAFADRHIYIEKLSLEGRTATRLQILEEAQRVEELVRMAGGSATEAARTHAQEMLEQARKF